MSTKVVGRRVAAILIDTIIIGIVNFVLLLACSALFGDTDSSGSSFSFSVSGGAGVVYFLLVFAVSIGYFVVYQGSTGQTIGKRTVDLKVVRDDGSGEPPGPGRAFVRWLLYLVDGFPYLLPYLLGFVVALTTKRNQRVGDMAASTLVVSLRARQPPPAGGPGDPSTR